MFFVFGTFKPIIKQSNDVNMICAKINWMLPDFNGVSINNYGELLKIICTQHFNQSIFVNSYKFVFYHFSISVVVVPIYTRIFESILVNIICYLATYEKS